MALQIGGLSGIFIGGSLAGQAWQAAHSADLPMEYIVLTPKGEETYKRSVRHVTSVGLPFVPISAFVLTGVRDAPKETQDHPAALDGA